MSQSFNTKFSDNRTSEKTQSYGFSECGYRPDTTPVPDEYLVRITSVRNQTTVVAPLQESVGFKVSSQWGPAVPKTIIGLWNEVTQSISLGRMSFVTKAMSRRIWTGSSPVAFTLHLKFEAVEDPIQEVVEPIRILQCLALPSEPKQGSEGQKDFWGGAQQIVPFLAPPGPTPFSAQGLLNLKILSPVVDLIEGLKGGDKIMVEIGRFLIFPNVVVREASSIVPVAFNSDGCPIRAEASVVFETYEMMTVQELNGVYKQTESEGS